MATFKNLKQLEKHLNKQIQDSLNTDVARKVIKTIQDHVESDVYDVYEAKQYERSGQLKESFQVEDYDGGIDVVATRKDGDRYIPEIIEYGHAKSEQGYEYPAYYRDGDNFIQPRPFMENARQEIKNENIHVNELKKSLKKKGLDVE